MIDEVVIERIKRVLPAGQSMTVSALAAWFRRPVEVFGVWTVRLKFLNTGL